VQTLFTVDENRFLRAYESKSALFAKLSQQLASNIASDFYGLSF
jgi:hypothetical protein